MTVTPAFRFRWSCRFLLLAGLWAGSAAGWPAATVTTLAGTPPGPGRSPTFAAPLALAVDGSGTLYVADTGNHAIRRVTPAGAVSTYAGVPGRRGSRDGPAGTALFNGPAGIALDRSGTLYVADAGNSAIRRITADGQVTTLAGMPGMPGNAEGPGPTAQLYWPAGLAVDGLGTVYVADTCNNCVRRIDAQGVMTTLAGLPGTYARADGSGPAARFNKPCGMAADGAGGLYLADTLNHRICRITPAGTVTTLAGSGIRGLDNGAGYRATFWGPMGLAVDASGNVFVADAMNQEIRRITPDGNVTTYAGTAREPGHADGPLAGSRFSGPSGVAVDASGNLYVADTMNGTIRKITP